MATIQELLKQADFYSDGELYVLVKLPPNAITVAASIIAEIGDPFCAMVVDKDEVTLVLPHEAVEEFGGRLRDVVVSQDRYRLITVDVVVPLDLFGFMAQLASALAAQEIPVFVYASYRCDHLLVPDAKFDAAITSLKHLANQ